jgi:MFS family permease
VSDDQLSQTKVSSLRTKGTRSSAYAWYVVGLLTVSYMFSVLDRQILNLLAPAIQQDLGIDDFQLSYLQGFFFVILYVLMGPLFGWLADRTSRNRVAGLGVGIWSMATALSSQAQNFTGLAAGRLGVGAGEAALGPAATSLISDLFPPERRAKALALFGVGPQFGSVLALLAAPLIIPASTVDLGLVGQLKPWQAAFLMAGLPGIAIAIALFLIREPKRQKAPIPTQKPQSFAAIRYVSGHRRAFLGAIGGSILIVCIAYTNAFNIPLFYSRTFGWSQNQIGLTIGLLNLFTLVPAGIAGGFLASHFRQRGRPEGTYFVMTIGCMVLGIPAVLTWLMPTPTLALIMLAISNLGMGLITPLISAVIPDLAPNEHRGQIVSWYLSGAQIFGAAIAPLGVAALSEYVYGGEQIRYSLATFNAILAPIALFVFLYAMPAVRKVATTLSLSEHDANLTKDSAT